MYKVLHWSALTYLSQLVHVADLPGHCFLHSACHNLLMVPSIKLYTVSGQTFPLTGHTIRNNLPHNVTSDQSTFRQHRKTSLFSVSFPDIILHNSSFIPHSQWIRKWFTLLGQLLNFRLIDWARTSGNYLFIICYYTNNKPAAMTQYI